MRIQHVYIPITAAAMILLLSACGSGTSSDHIVSSTPSTPGAGNTIDLNVDTSSTSFAGASSNSGSNASNTPAPDFNAIPAPPSSNANAGAVPPPSIPAPESNSQPALSDEVIPISSQGVRGDVFLAMLEQKACGHIAVMPANGTDGSKGSENMFDIFADTDLGNYKVDPNYAFTPLFVHSLGCNGKTYEAVTAGGHSYTVTNRVFAKLQRPPRPFNLLNLEVPINLTPEDITIGSTLNTETTIAFNPDASWSTVTSTLTTDSPYKVRQSELVPFGTLKKWKNDGQLVQLMLLQGSSPQEARMCWHIDLTHVKRLQCMIWSVPEDWKTGGTLNSVNVTLIEDRSVYEGETGMAYWD